MPNANQKWYFQPAGSGYYYVRNFNGKYLDVLDGGTVNGTNVQVWSFNGSDAQKWKVLDVPVNSSADPNTPPNPAEPTNPANPASPSDQNPSNQQQVDSEAAQPASVAGAAVTGVKAKTYTGEALTQSPAVALDGKALRAGADYELSYASNVGAGTATMTITGKGAYTGAKAVTFTINKANVKNATVAKVKAQKYRKGKAVKPNPKLTFKGKTLKKGTDYTLAYKNNKRRGTATITVKGKGNFKGAKTVKFKIK